VGGAAVFSFGAIALGPVVLGFSVEDAGLLVGLVGYAIWWAYELRRGSKVSQLALGTHILIYGLLAAYVWSSGVLALYRDGLTASVTRATLFLVPVTVPFLVSMVLGHRFASKRLVVERTPSGRWTYRGAAAVPFLWLLLWLVRLGLEDGPLRGYSVFTGPWLGVPAPSSVSALVFGATVGVVVGIYFVSFGFLIGFSVAVWRSFRHTRHAFEARLPTWEAGRGTPVSVEPFSPGSPTWTFRPPDAGPYHLSGARGVGPGPSGRPAAGVAAWQGPTTGPGGRPSGPTGPDPRTTTPAKRARGR